ncbi:doublecortin domain-containing protein 2-like [Silurus meridionalis]|uniref:Doublecortin domain-containing protein n=1 Tax=Silurus meridionalis TaxID=175797 RepID=A0A8T0BMR6_SILME|nr:doublecortin domain-containing protein 2-like [Silurus meridionalis]KAF7708368.1 hypothetical protein HF521_017425 [Silurus meridionalis]
MSDDKTNFRAQPAVKSIFVYRNGDAHADARRVLIHEKRVCDFETLLREVTGRVRAPFGAVRCIYTPRAGHRVDALEHVRHGEQYVAAGKERFKKLDYLQIGSRKKQMLQNNGLVKAAPQKRIIVSARFLKPIKEPCAIFVIANGDVLNPAVRFLVPNRLLSQFEKILEMITEKMGLRILGGVRSLCSCEGVPVTDGKDLENGQFYVAVGRDKFKPRPYADLLFTKPAGMRRNVRSKAASLPPIYTRQNGDAVNGVIKSNQSEEAKFTEPTASLVRQISQARLMAIRKKRSNLTKSFSTQDNDDADPKPECEDMESERKPAEVESTSDEQVYSNEDKAAGEKEAAAGEDEASEQAEDAIEQAEEAAEQEEDGAAQEEEAEEQEDEAEEQEEEAAAQEEEEATQEEEAGEQEDEAEEQEEEAAAQEEEEATQEEEEVAVQEKKQQRRKKTQEQEKIGQQRKRQ